MKPANGFGEFVQVCKHFRTRAENEIQKDMKLIKRGTHKVKRRTSIMMHRSGDEKEKKFDEKEEVEVDEKTPFEIECETTPGPIKDHMPFWYLTYLQQLQDSVDAGQV